MSGEDPFLIDEAPQALHGWDPTDERGPTETIEDDLRALMRSLADVRLELDEEKQGRKDEVAKLLLSIAEVLDAFDRVFRNIHQKEDQITKQMKIWVNNFRTIQRLADKIISEHGVSAIENLDQGFDPEWHRVVETVEDPGRNDGTIVAEIKRGYVWDDSILRKAEVTVVRNAGSSNDREEDIPAV
jgi:molecular chaperone GrpE (heat shock protein)